MPEKISEKIGSVVVELANAVVNGRGFVAGSVIKPHLDRLQFLKTEVEELENSKTSCVVFLPFVGKANEEETNNDDTPPAA